MSKQKQSTPILEAIVPVKDRAELKLCVRSLLSPSSPVARIIICDGGSTNSECLTLLDDLAQQHNIEVLRFPSPVFNKARLINQGILQARSGLLLISDADIIWNSATLNKLYDLVSSNGNRIYSVLDVEESHPDSIALRRERYTYEIHVDNCVTSVNIIRASAHNTRPGCGLICTRKDTLLALGGYKEIFTGWGWEDQDLLIRAQLLGVQVGTIGKVIHLSHGDNIRNRYNGNFAPTETRDRNIIISSQLLAQGMMMGDLVSSSVLPDPSNQIEVNIPESLKAFSTFRDTRSKSPL